MDKCKIHKSWQRQTCQHDPNRFTEWNYHALETQIKWQTLRTGIVLIMIQAMKNCNKLSGKKRYRKYGMTKLIIKHRYWNHKKMNQRKSEEKKPCVEATRRNNAVRHLSCSLFARSSVFQNYYSPVTGAQLSRSHALLTGPAQNKRYNVKKNMAFHTIKIFLLLIYKFSLNIFLYQDREFFIERREDIFSILFRWWVN